MKLILHLISIYIYVSLSQSSVYTNAKNNVLDFLKKSQLYFKRDDSKFYNKQAKKKERSDLEIARSKIEALDRIRKNGRDVLIKSKGNSKISRERYHKDPVLNFIRRKGSLTDGTSDTESSSMEIGEWKDEWRQQWVQKKFEAINSTAYRGDTVNMVGARPWGVPCGDPNQHDMPWGSCMLPMECESEYRIYRGDVFCGRTQFICCSLLLTNYDMYQGFDASFEDSNLATDSEERRNRLRGSKERKQRKKLKEKKKRRNDRIRRKRKIKRNIEKIIKEIQRILKRAYRNGTIAMRRKTRQLKKFIEALKKQYKKDRHTVKDIHMLEFKNVDVALQTRLNQVSGLNQNFDKNSTFRDIVVNGTINPKVARMLMETYPDLVNMLNTRRANRNSKDDISKDYLNYDIEYGYLYH